MIFGIIDFSLLLSVLVLFIFVVLHDSFKWMKFFFYLFVTANIWGQVFGSGERVKIPVADFTWPQFVPVSNREFAFNRHNSWLCFVFSDLFLLLVFVELLTIVVQTFYSSEMFEDTNLLNRSRKSKHRQHGVLRVERQRTNNDIQIKYTENGRLSGMNPSKKLNRHVRYLRKVIPRRLEHFVFTLGQEFTKMLARAFLKLLYWKGWFEIL